MKNSKNSKQLKNMKDAKEAINGRVVSISKKISRNKKNSLTFDGKWQEFFGFVKRFTKNLLSGLNFLNTCIRKSTFQSFYVIYAASPSKNLTARLAEFYQLWPLHQWISSLVGLIVLYWITGYFYNKWLSHHGGWLNWERRIWLIIFDFSINLILGIYYMNYRETVLGAIMLKCPIAISPLIFILELVCFYMYSRFVKKNTHKKSG